MRFDKDDAADLFGHLDDRCDYCSPSHGRWDGQPGACDKCDGSGFVLNDAGKELIAFLRRHGFVAPPSVGRAQSAGAE